MNVQTENTTTGKGNIRQKIFNIAGIVLCVILIPILILNLTLIIKSYTNKDKVPSIGGYMPLIVLTDSMYPEIKSGDMIISRTIDAESIKVGDVISFFDPDGSGTSVVTHRVTEIINENGSLGFRTKGDANNAEDRLTVPADKLVGICSGRIAGAGNIAMFMQTTPGLVICVILPLLLLIGYDVLRRRIYDKHKKEDTDALLAELEALKAKNAQDAEKPEPVSVGTENDRD